ncbi:MAG: hypothetical protein IKG82_05935 [Oscillospiraceae bacterium]|nr:hypothetical protein [Oscillospiraceae bacterium]MBR4200559.1 hypothetical protein [Oscillospiraceae bacterium]
MNNKAELQSQVDLLMYRMMDDIIQVTEKKLGNKMNYNDLKAVVKKFEEIQFSTSDKLDQIFEDYSEKSD